MKKIILKFIGVGINNQNQALVYIFDKYGQILYKKRTYNGYLIVNLTENDVYKVYAKMCNDIIKTSFYITNDSSEYILFFNHSILNYIPSGARTITFLLTDANYNNLPVGKGEMIVWPK